MYMWVGARKCIGVGVGGWVHARVCVCGFMHMCVWVGVCTCMCVWVGVHVGGCTHVYVGVGVGGWVHAHVCGCVGALVKSINSGYIRNAGCYNSDSIPNTFSSGSHINILNQST